MGGPTLRPDEDYRAFLDGKRREWGGAGIALGEAGLPDGLFPVQARLTAWALRKGRAGIFATTGMGKSRMQAAWSARVVEATGGRVLMLAPLCVEPQTIAEAAAIGVEVRPFGTGAPIEILNYERLHHVNPALYAGIDLDESSILKALDGKTRTRLIAMFAETPYRLCCTATPAPNDIAELANHCEFLGIMTRAEMLATFFVHDDAGWRLKGHAHAAFYRWLASWGMFLCRPSDLGFSDAGYELPPLVIEDVVVGEGGPVGEFLFPGLGLGGIGGRLTARQDSLQDRLEATRKIVDSAPGQWIVWCGLNEEQWGITALLGEQAVSVAGQDKEADKVAKIRAFLDGRARVLVSKVRIAGFGLNLQRCHQMVFLGLGDSWEQYFQAIRRCWRYGQASPVRVAIVVSQAETEIVANVRRKETEAEAVATAMIAHMAAAEREEIGMTERQRETVERRVEVGDGWRLCQGDCVEVLADEPEASADLSVYSPPFISLYTYTNTEHDLGNAATKAEFFAHFAFVVRAVLRLTKPGRLTCCHLAQVPAMKARDGYIGMKDMRGPAVELYEHEGWIYQGEVVIDKDPQAQAIRVRAKGLAFQQLHKDASWMRPALADYILLFRKPGDNAVPIVPDVNNEEWIEWARPIWYGIRETDTLNVAEARANDDDRHICPLQLGTIERCIRLWSNSGEVVLSPFAGIGSEGYEALRHGRRYLGVELKPEYFMAAVKNLRRAEALRTAQPSLPLGPGPS